jgi:hypothetical protein
LKAEDGAREKAIESATEMVVLGAIVDGTLDIFRVKTMPRSGAKTCLKVYTEVRLIKKAIT